MQREKPFPNTPETIMKSYPPSGSSHTSIRQLSQCLATQPLHFLGIKSRAPLPRHSLTPDHIQSLSASLVVEDATGHTRLGRRQGRRKSEADGWHTRLFLEISDVGQVATDHADEGGCVGGELVFFGRLGARGDDDASSRAFV
jgi:hypothetical protein